MNDINGFPDEHSFISAGNFSSHYCILSSLENENHLDGFGDYVGFMLHISVKHVNAGLPEDSIVGTTIRRLLIGLSRCPNVYKIIYLFDENKCCEKTYNTINGLIHTDKTLLERACKMGRMEDYGIKITDIENIFLRIKSIKTYKISDSDRLAIIEKLKSEMTKDIVSTDELKLQNESNFLNWHPKIGYNSKLDLVDTPIFSEMENIYEYIESKLLRDGKIGKDRDNLMRIQFNDTFRAGISSDYVIQEFENFLEDICGIKHASRLYNECVRERGIFFNRISEGEINKYENFVMELENAINSKQLCYSKILFFVTQKDGIHDQTQVGWESITPYLDYNKEEHVTNISLQHNLRSVDFYDGFPLNLYFCIKISEDIINAINSNVRLGTLFINIAYLHAYIDSIPEKIYLSKIQ